MFKYYIYISKKNIIENILVVSLHVEDTWGHQSCMQNMGQRR